LLDGERKRGLPEEGKNKASGGRNEDDASHAGCGSIEGPKGSGVGVDDFAELGGMSVQVTDEPAEVVEESCMDGVSRIRRWDSWRRVSWKRLKRPRKPGMARTMLHSLPMICCQRLVAIRVLPEAFFNGLALHALRGLGDVVVYFGELVGGVCIGNPQQHDNPLAVVATEVFGSGLLVSEDAITVNADLVG
jgi:hypothetical protein